MKVQSLFWKVNSYCNEDGNAIERLIFFVMEGLRARLKGMTAEEYLKPRHVLRSVSIFPGNLTCFQALLILFCLQDFIQVSKLFSRVPLLSFVSDTANDIITQATQHCDVIHIVDLCCWTQQWKVLLKSLSERPGGPPLMKFSVVEPPPGAPWAMGPCLPASAMREELVSYASEYNIVCKFRAVTSRLEDLTTSSLGLCSSDTIVVCGFYCIKQLPDASVLRSNPRDTFLKVRSTDASSL